jgi:endonuclease YncB( thermonuclease family)
VTHRVLMAIALMLAVCVFSLQAGTPRAVPHPAVPHPAPGAVPHPVPPSIRSPQAVSPHFPQPSVNPQMHKRMGEMQKELNHVPKGLKDGMEQLGKGKLPGGAGDLLKGVQNAAKGAAMKAAHSVELKPIPVTQAKSLKHQLHQRARVFEDLHARHLGHGHWHRHDWHHWRWGYYLPIAGAAGQVVEVSSGNRIVVLNGDNVRTSVRLFGTGAPGIGQAFFSESQGNLSGLALNEFVNVVEMGQDADGTLVAQVFLKAEETYLSDAQIRQGMAWYAYDDGEAPDLAAAEEEAQTAGRGLWSNPDAPWEYSD